MTQRAFPGQSSASSTLTLRTRGRLIIFLKKKLRLADRGVCAETSHFMRHAIEHVFVCKGVRPFVFTPSGDHNTPASCLTDQKERLLPRQDGVAIMKARILVTLGAVVGSRSDRHGPTLRLFDGN